jgi:hypothetical protein
MALTKAQIRDRAGEALGFNPIRQSLESNVATRIEQSYDEVYAMLKEEGLATWASTGSVPNEIVPYVVNLVADGCISLGASAEKIQVIKSEKQLAMPMIRRYVTPAYQSQEDQKDY